MILCAFPCTMVFFAAPVVQKLPLRFPHVANAHGPRVRFPPKFPLARSSGLSEAFDARVPIYCSATTARLMRAKFPRVKFTALALDEEHTIPLIVSSMVGLERVAGGLETRELFMTVRLVPVEHCPGAVMFLCKSPVFGSVLYTGDFRLSEPLMNDARLCNVDALVLDTTNMNSGMCYFPPIEHGVSMAVAEARACAAADRDVVFRFRHLGFDLLLVRMAEDLGVPVRIHSRKLWKELKLAGLDMDQHFVMAHKAVDVRGEPRVHAVPYNDVDEVMERLRLARPKRAPRLLMACCLEERTARGQLRTDRIPFSRHSSHAELVDFIHHVGAKRIFALHMLGGYQIFVHGTSIRRGNPDSVNAALSAVPLAMKGGRFAAALDGLGRHMAQQVAAAKASLHFNQSRRHALRFRDQHALGRNAFATRSPKLGADRVAVLVAQSNARVEQSKRKAREQLDATAVGLADRTSRRPPAKPDSVQRNAETPPLFWSL